MRRSSCQRSKLSEEQTAEKAVLLADRAQSRPETAQKNRHVGYYLIGKGRFALERECQARLRVRNAVEHFIRHFPFTYYQGGILLITLLTTVEFASAMAGPGRTADGASTSSPGFSSCARASSAVSLVNWLVDLADPAAAAAVAGLLIRALPAGMTDFGRCADHATSVGRNIDRFVERLEVHYLANRDEHLHFALFTDFQDAAKETMPDDAVLLERASEGFEALNEQVQGRSQ